MPPLYLLIKPASSLCNMRCGYCFYHDIGRNREQSDYGMMSLKTLENIVEKALAYGEKECTFAFQGGEPTLAGLSFYEKLIEFQKCYNRKKLTIHNVIQTNGYDLPKEWAAFLAENKFLVGISLDGTKHTHNLYRKSSGGEDTFFNILHTIDLLKEYKAEFNILTVVNSKTVAFPKKIYEFYQKNKFKYLQFIPCLDPLGEEWGKEGYSLSPRAYGRFLNDLFNLWFDDIAQGKESSVRQFDNYISILLGLGGEACDMRGICSIQNVVEADGEVYPCDFFVLDKYKLGNLNYVGFEDIMEQGKKLKFVESSMTTETECRSCRYFPLCRGGCRRHRMGEGQSLGRNYFCEAYKIFFGHCLERMEYLAGHIRKSKKYNI